MKKQKKKSYLRKIISFAVVIAVIVTLAFVLPYINGDKLINAFDKYGFNYELSNPKPVFVVEDKYGTIIRKNGYEFGTENIMGLAESIQKEAGGKLDALSDDDFHVDSWGNFSNQDNTIIGMYYEISKGCEKVYEAISPTTQFKIIRAGRYLFVLKSFEQDSSDEFLKLLDSLGGTRQMNFEID